MKALVGAAVAAILAGTAMLGIAYAQQAHQAAQRLHPGQRDADGLPVPPPHDDTCPVCHGGDR